MRALRSDRLSKPVEKPVQKHHPVCVIEALGLGSAFHIGSALNHVASAGQQADKLPDLEQALFYIEQAVDTYPPTSLAMSDHEVDGVALSWELSSNLREAVRFLVRGQWVAAHLMIATETEQLRQRAASELAT